nr:uncharacterized protein LOC113705783 [Coffea arabica]XP_027083494.1 uncharacterized protein LOC113705784 [Coffea arabica]
MKLLSRQGGIGPSSSNAHVACCSICGGEHDTNECVDSEQVQFVNNYNRNAPNNPYSNTYNPGWTNHPNFGWKDQGNQQRPTNPPGFQSRQPQAETKPSWEIAVEKLAKVTSDRFEQVEGRLDQLAGMYRNLEVQIGQIANVINNRNPGELPSKTEVNPREHVNAIILRSGKTVEGFDFENSGGEKDKKQAIEGEQESQNDHVIIDIDALHPKLNSNVIPFPHRLKKDGQDREFEKFFKMFKQLHINIPFIDAITQIPSYARFLKDIMSKKRKIVDNEMIALTEECSALIKNKLPPKLKDPGSFSIPCTIGQLHFSNDLCDLGASVSLMPLSVARRLGLQELKATNITLQLADRSITRSMGILENVLIKVRQSIIPVDFVVLDIEEDVRMPIILGRPFLATARTIIDVEKGKLILRVNGEELEFNLDNKDGSIEPTTLVSNMPYDEKINQERTEEVKFINVLGTNFHGVGTKEEKIRMEVGLINSPFHEENSEKLSQFRKDKQNPLQGEVEPLYDKSNIPPWHLRKLDYEDQCMVHHMVDWLGSFDPWGENLSLML